MSLLGRPTWAIFDVNLHQRVTALDIERKNISISGDIRGVDIVYQIVQIWEPENILF